MAGESTAGNYDSGTKHVTGLRKHSNLFYTQGFEH